VRITKYVHSCLLFEHEEEALLFDPGLYSFIEGRVTPEHFRDVSTIVITHTHPDHLNPDALGTIVSLSGAQVIGNGEVAKALAGVDIPVQVLDEGVVTRGAFTLRAIPTPHEPILADVLPQHTAYLVNDRVLNGADSFGEPLLPYAGTEVLVLPVMAPFLTEVRAFDYAQRMRPRQIIPVHDGYSRDFFIAQRYDNYAARFAAIGVEFHRLAQPGDGVEI
jgi:L-ascorbate metabolism protein UlaG (beta-lactamase superfamily)